MTRWMTRCLVGAAATLAAARALAQAPAEPPPGGAEEATPAEPQGPSPEDAAAQGAAVDRLFSILRSEPSIREVQRAALRHYELEPERVRSLVSSAHLKGLIPEIEGSFDLQLGSHFTNTLDGLYPILPSVPENPNPNNYKERVRGQQTSNTFHIRAVFNLDRLVFNSEALDAKSLNSLGENLVREVTTLYFSRRRLMASLLLSPPQADTELFYELMRLDELTATLDALTGGRFADRAWRWDQNQEDDDGGGGSRRGPAGGGRAR